MQRSSIDHQLSGRRKNLSLLVESLGEAAEVGLEVALVAEELDVGTVDLDAALLALGDVLLAAERGEAPVLGDDDLLATRELVLGAAESLEGGGLVGVLGADGQKNLANVDTGNGAVRLSESTTHTGLETIGTSARQHLVDADDVVRVGADAEMERLLSRGLHHVLVGANTGSLESLGGQLLVLVGDHVDAQGELVDIGLLATEIEDANLGVGHTTVEPGLGVRLVLAVPVATGGSPGHFDGGKAGF